MLSFVPVRILDRYLLTEWVKVFALCLLSFGGLLMLSEAYNWIPEFLSWGSSFATITTYLGLSLVTFMSMLLPISLLISVIFVLATMNRNQELAAARAAGIGMWRLTAPLWAVGLFFAGFLAALNAYWVPDALEEQTKIHEREQFAALLKKGGAVLPSNQSDFISFDNTKAHRLWLMTRLGLTTGKAFEVIVHTFDEKGRELRTVSARLAEFKKVAGRWQWTFREGRDLHFDPTTGSLLSQPRFQELTLPDYDDDPEVMLFATRAPDTLSLREVSRFVEQTGSNPTGRNAAYAMRYHAIMSAPMICLVVIAVAIPFSVTGGRISPMVGVAKTFGLFIVFFFVSSLCSAFGESGALPPIVAAWLPVVLTAAWVVPKLRAVN